MRKALILVLTVMTTIGFDFALPRLPQAPQELPQWAQITMQNQFPYTVDFYIDGVFACRALANLFCTAQVKVKPGSYQLDARDGDGKRQSTKLVDGIARGDSITWSTVDNDISRAIASQSASIEPPPVNIKNPGEGLSGNNGPGSESGGGKLGGGASGGSGLGGIILLLGGAALAGVGIYALTKMAGNSGCSTGYLPCGDTGKCCPEDHHFYSPSHDACYDILASIDDKITCHPQILKLRK